jgi:hypothetical protein
MRLTAHVRRTTGATAHSVGSDVSGAGTLFEPATRLEIVAEANGVTLIRYSALGAFVGDTWHTSVEEAKRQARFEFETEPSDWKESEADA